MQSIKLVHYLTRKILILVLTLIGLLTVTFIISHIIPINPVVAWAGRWSSEEAQRAIAERYHLNEPLWIQYLYFISNFFRGDLGISPSTHNPVWNDLFIYFPVTLELSIFAMLIAIAIGIPVGILSAAHRNKIYDHVLRFLTMGANSIPLFWLALVMQFIFYYILDWFPGIGLIDLNIRAPPRMTGFISIDSLIVGDVSLFLNHLSHMVLPSVTLSFIVMPVIARIVRASVLDNLTKDYVMALRARGLSEWSIFKHVLKNALIPVITVAGLRFGNLLGGAVMVEFVFHIPGLGKYAYDSSILYLDFPAIMGFTLITGLTFLSMNFVIDFIYGYIDPRTRT